MSSQASAVDASSVAGGLPPLEGRLAGDDKTDGGFNASFGLNSMSADDPCWIGHGFQAQAVEDFLSSPEWTDPSPALTDSMSFDLESCDTSPLLPMDSYDGDHGLAGAPLFSPMDGYASSNVSPLEAPQGDFGAAAAGDFGAPEMGADFTLFPESTTSERKRPAEMAFSQAKPKLEDPTLTLLRALSSAALQGASAAAPAPTTLSTPTPALPVSTALTASPLAVSSGSITPASVTQQPVAEEVSMITAAPMGAPAAVDASTAPQKPEAPRRASSTSSSSLSAAGKPEARGTKRRLDAADLLPLDAPIQPRKYHAVSATSRRDTPASSLPTEGEDPFAAEEDAIRKERDPRVAKRLSNTLAARRSRHRKAEELRMLHETIEDLRGEVEMWKKRCERAEKERDEARL